MRRDDWRQEIPFGTMLAHSSSSRAYVEIPLGHRRGRLVLRVQFDDESALGDRASFDLSWADRPGDPISVSPETLIGKDYLTHAALDLKTGEIEVQPGWGE